MPLEPTTIAIQGAVLEVEVAFLLEAAHQEVAIAVEGHHPLVLVQVEAYLEVARQELVGLVDNMGR